MMVQWHIHYIPATIICLVMGGAIGAAQGYWIAYHKIPSFIVTLAGMLVFRGLALWLLGGQSVGPFPPQFQLLSSGFIPDFLQIPASTSPSMLVGIVTRRTDDLFQYSRPREA